jgi:alkylhydroperoxidase family enzyme
MGKDEVAVTELMAVVDHVNGLTKLVEGLGLAPDVPEPAPDPAWCPVRPIAEDKAVGRVAEVFREIRAHAAASLGLDRVPSVWRALAHHPLYLEATWAREKALMASGEAIPPLQKTVLGYSIAANNCCPYFVAYYGTALRVGGLDERAVLEALAFVDYFNGLNKLADGMGIESDIRPYLTYAE